MTTMTTVTAHVPAYAADTLNESVKLKYPAAWADRVEALLPRLCYGPDFSRAIIESLLDMTRQISDGYTSGAYDSLTAAERANARRPR